MTGRNVRVNEGTRRRRSLGGESSLIILAVSHRWFVNGLQNGMIASIHSNFHRGS